VYVDMYFESVQISYLCIYVSTAVPTAIGVVDIGPALRLPVRSDGPGPGVGLRALQSTEVRIRRRWTRLTFARHTGRRTPPLQTPRAAHELDPPVFLFPSPSVRSASTTTAAAAVRARSAVPRARSSIGLHTEVTQRPFLPRRPSTCECTRSTGLSPLDRRYSHAADFGHGLKTGKEETTFTCTGTSSNALHRGSLSLHSFLGSPSLRSSEQTPFPQLGLIPPPPPPPDLYAEASSLKTLSGWVLHVFPGHRWVFI